MLNPGFTAPLLHPAPQVTVFHDLQHKRHPEYFRWLDLPAWRFLLWSSARRSRKLIAVSEATRIDLQAEYGKDAVVIPHGVDQRFFDIGLSRKAGGPPKPLILYVSTLHPHKNHVRLIRVFAGLRKARPELHLILAGIRGFHTDKVLQEIRSLALQDGVTITGWISDSQLDELYRTAAVFVYPSTFEGFGMPILEALAADLPTACSAIEPMRSLAGDAAWLFDPADESQMFGALARLLKGELPPGKGPEQARHYSWDAAARQTLEVLQSAAA